MDKITESSSNHNDLETKSVKELLAGINQEDQQVAHAVQNVMGPIENLCKAVIKNMQTGGRLFYLGAGTSGRLGILDASECPPTYGVPHGWVVGLIAGGDGAIRKAVEFAEDDPNGGWKDLQAHNVQVGDTVIGIAASGTTPYVIGAIQTCAENGITTGCITCNEGSPLAQAAEHPIEVVVGPEFVTGSTRMKAGTAQKLVLNMISTTAMIQLGRVKGNRMVHMQLSNNKLVHRGERMLMDTLNISQEEASALLNQYQSVQAVLDAGKEK